MILFIDNYDSFTYNLVDYLGQLEPNTLIVRNDKISLDRILSLKPKGIVLSPGPGKPEDAGICTEIIASLYQKIPILGVCLGHQCIGSVFGAKICRAPSPMHGKVSEIFHSKSDLLYNLPNPFQATRYHSLIIDRDSLSAELKITAETKDGLIMGIQHRKYPLVGFQFHPESILTNCGFKLLRNWLEKFVVLKTENSRSDNEIEEINHVQKVH